MYVLAAICLFNLLIADGEIDLLQKFITKFAITTLEVQSDKLYQECVQKAEKKYPLFYPVSKNQ